MYENKDDDNERKIKNNLFYIKEKPKQEKSYAISNILLQK